MYTLKLQIKWYETPPVLVLMRHESVVESLLWYREFFRV